MQDIAENVSQRKPQLICENVSLGYDGSIVAEDINFTVCEGDYLCILGENGSGKSTLIKALLGLKKQVGGEIKHCGDMKPGDIGYLPQQTSVQRDFPASVREIVRSGCIAKTGFRPFYSREEKMLADAVMKKLGITELARHCYRDLSGGQQQRVLLARALCAAHKMLLLDEPVTGLDPKAQTEMYELTAGLNKEGVTVIMVSHDLSAAIRYASHILHIGAHRSLFFGTAGEYKESDVGKAFSERTVSENG